MFALTRVLIVTVALFSLASLIPLATPLAAAQSALRYIVNVAELEVLPATLEKVIDALKVNGAATIKEPGCRQHDILWSAANPTQIVIYEAYADRAAVEARRASAHFKKCRATTGKMVVEHQPRPMISIAMNSKNSRKMAVKCQKRLCVMGVLNAPRAKGHHPRGAPAIPASPVGNWRRT